MEKVLGGESLGPGLVVHAFNPSCKETAMKMSESTKQVPGQTSLDSKGVGNRKLVIK